MIPKVLHFVWLSNDPFPDLVRTCLQSWRQVMPDFEIRCWSLSDLEPLDLCDFARQAIEVRRWAFATDVIRLAILQTHGGVYLDSDVLAFRSLLPLMGYGCFSAVEFHPAIFEAHGGPAMLDEAGSRRGREGVSVVPGIGLQAAIMGAIPGHPFIEACLDYYKGRSFVLGGGRFNEDPIAPSIYGTVAESFGFRWRNECQILSLGIAVMPCSVIASHPNQRGQDTIVAHCCAGSWR
jgi:mannosyltransferase OCH1-like enzyme